MQHDTPSLELESFDGVAEEDNDDATLIQSHSTSLTSTQYVVYSATFQVPAFYFTIHDSHGSPLSSTDILKTFLFRRFPRDGTDTTSFAITLPTSSFPLLSQGDHPTLGTPCWYFHPCETSMSVNEVMTEVLQDEWTEDECLVRWLEAWFMILGTAVDLKC
ncbi:hypothetical protein PILCRDRAFT_59000 [Piloderma croceum F 1598]|uniref:Ubiquitin-like-conjugating enzyme ATG10 n=1 Tax=Piloderma croceum (strain F 1598) TaxID=765440 RepID=A0A0C3CM21_PILCF|nr:hypothetical protein PILCRDRAFT_59000 [Piloderma croceum F 1598]